MKVRDVVNRNGWEKKNGRRARGKRKKKEKREEQRTIGEKS